ncbi:MAG: hypothetical protein ACR2HF_00255, partial [Methylococcaceae bacterium]
MAINNDNAGIVLGDDLDQNQPVALLKEISHDIKAIKSILGAVSPGLIDSGRSQVVRAVQPSLSLHNGRSASTASTVVNNYYGSQSSPVSPGGVRVERSTDSTDSTERDREAVSFRNHRSLLVQERAILAALDRATSGRVASPVSRDSGFLGMDGLAGRDAVTDGNARARRSTAIAGAAGRRDTSLRGSTRPAALLRGNGAAQQSSVSRLESSIVLARN